MTDEISRNGGSCDGATCFRDGYSGVQVFIRGPAGCWHHGNQRALGDLARLRICVGLPVWYAGAHSGCYRNLAVDNLLLDRLCDLVFPDRQKRGQQ